MIETTRVKIVPTINGDPPTLPRVEQAILKNVASEAKLKGQAPFGIEAGLNRMVQDNPAGAIAAAVAVGAIFGWIVKRKILR